MTEHPALGKTFVREFEKKDGSVLSIHQCEIGDVGCVLWDAAIVLSSYLETPNFCSQTGDNLLAGKNVIELGSGTGIVGLQASSLGANAFITDLPDFLPLLELNIKENSHLLKGKTEARTLVWGNDVSSFLPHPQYVFMADCIYYDESLEPLVNTMEALCGPDTCILCCYEERQTEHKRALEKKFYELIGKTFQVEKIPLQQQDPIFRSEDIHILKLMIKTMGSNCVS